MTAPPGPHLPAAPTPPPLPDSLAALVAVHHGCVRWDELAGCGIGEQAAATLVRRGALVRVARGAYVEGRRWAEAPARERHALLAVAIARTWGPDTAVSHASAAVLHGLPLLRLPSVVEGSRTRGGQGRRRRAHTVYRGYPGVHPVRCRGVQVVPVADAAVGVADRYGLEAGVVVLDAALHAGATTREAVQELVDRCRVHPVHARAAAVLALADGRSESPGETRTRLLLGRLGIEVEPQVNLVTADGEWLGRVDLRVRGERVVVEFDGMVKYRDHGRLAVEDKRRDLAMQRAGHEVVRLVWADLDRPEAVRQMVADAVARSRRRCA